MTDERSADPGGNEPAGTNDSADVDELAGAIEQTRDDMTGTAEAIGDRLDPANIVEDAKQTVRAATVGKVERMAGNAADTANEVISEARSTAENAGTGILETVRRNPIPALMAGIGIGWLVMNRSSGARPRRSMDERGRWREDLRSRPARYPGRSGALEAAADTGGTVDQIGRQAGELADQVRATMDRMPDEVGGAMRDARWSAQRIVEENPLAAGAVAVAVGAAIGMALPETQAERVMLHPAADRAIETAERAATDAVQQLEAAQA